MSIHTDHKAAFMAAVKGIPVNFVTRAMNVQTIGRNWSGSSKEYMARCYAGAHVGTTATNKTLKDVDLDKLRATAQQFQQDATRAAAERKLRDERIARDRAEARQRSDMHQADLATVRAAIQRGDGIEGSRVLKLTIAEYAALCRIIQP